jgi:putative transposase
MDIFENDEDRQLYLRLIREQTERWGVEILGWCLMTNHVHFLAVPNDELSLAKAFGEAHRRYTRMKNSSMDARGYLFQGRFGSSVLDERHLVAAACYVDQNPVRAHMVDRAWDYPWSSARFHVGLVKSDLLVNDRTLKGLVQNWSELLCRHDSEANQKIRTAARTGRPIGDEGFLRSIGSITGRNLVKGKPGRPPKANGTNSEK